MSNFKRVEIFTKEYSKENFSQLYIDLMKVLDEEVSLKSDEQKLVMTFELDCPHAAEEDCNE